MMDSFEYREIYTGRAKAPRIAVGPEKITRSIVGNIFYEGRSRAVYHDTADNSIFFVANDGERILGYAPQTRQTNPAASVAYTKLNKIYKLIRNSNEAYAIAKDFGWVDGGCWMLAAAVKPLCPGSHLIAVISADSMYMQHVALEWDGWYLDGTGVRTRESFLRYWRYDRVDGLGKGTEAIPFDPKLLDEESRPFYKRAAKLREYLIRNGV